MVNMINRHNVFIQTQLPSWLHWQMKKKTPPSKNAFIPNAMFLNYNSILPTHEQNSWHNCKNAHVESWIDFDKESPSKLYLIHCLIQQSENLGSQQCNKLNSIFQQGIKSQSVTTFLNREYLKRTTHNNAILKWNTSAQLPTLSTKYIYILILVKKQDQEDICSRILLEFGPCIQQVMLYKVKVHFLSNYASAKHNMLLPTT